MNYWKIWANAGSMEWIRHATKWAWICARLLASNETKRFTVCWLQSLVHVRCLKFLPHVLVFRNPPFSSWSLFSPISLRIWIRTQRSWEHILEMAHRIGRSSPMSLSVWCLLFSMFQFFLFCLLHVLQMYDKLIPVRIAISYQPLSTRSLPSGERWLLFVFF